MVKEKGKGMLVACKRCGYEWTTRGTLFYVPCPRCHTLMKIRELPPKKKAEKEE